MMDNAVSIGPSKDAANFDGFTCPKCGGSKPSCCSCPTPAAPAKPCLGSPLKERARRVVEDTPRGTLNSLELLIQRVTAFGDEVRNEAATAERKRIQKAVGLLPLHVREIPGSSTAQSLYLAEDVFAAIGDDGAHGNRD